MKTYKIIVKREAIVEHSYLVEANTPEEAEATWIDEPDYDTEEYAGCEFIHGGDLETEILDVSGAK